MAKRGSSAPDGRSRSWTVVTFDELETWRQRQGLPKKRVADRLGVTNSTYHNWARGIAVATPATQHKIHALINGAEVVGAPHPGSRHHNGGAERLDLDGSALLSSTAQIVNAYLQSGPAASRLTPDGLCQLIRDVTKALQ